MLSRLPRCSWCLSCALLLIVGLWLPANSTIAAPRIGVATMQPGEIFWERFGHDAIVVDDPTRGEPISYNFGFFDLEEPGFVWRFILGEMEYELVALPFAKDLIYYRDTGRGVSIQWLDLSETQATHLAAALAENARPENARYRYDYFTNNCATRVRDALDEALDGLLQRQMQTRSHGNTYRSEAVRLAAPADWMWLGFDVLLGPFADQLRSRWEDSFVPMNLADNLRQARRVDGEALVRSEQILLPHRVAPEPPPAPRRWWPWLLIGAGIACAFWLLARSDSRRAAWAALPFWILCTLLGLLMLFVWGFTSHRAIWANHNLLLFNPACLLLLPGAVRLLRGRNPGRVFTTTLLVVLVGAALSLFLLWLPVQPQRNAPWIALMLPVHAMLWWLLTRRPALHAALSGPPPR